MLKLFYKQNLLNCVFGNVPNWLLQIGSGGSNSERAVKLESAVLLPVVSSFSVLKRLKYLLLVRLAFT